MPDPNTLPLVRLADTAGNPANPGGGSGTANPYPGSDYAKDTKQPTLVSGRVPVDGSAVTQPISAVSLPLPTGAATDGADPGSPAVANAGSGMRGWLGTIAGLLKLGTQTKAQSGSVTIATDQGNIEPGGAAITGATMPSGGIGLTGWLSAVWSALTVANQRSVITVETASGAAIAANQTVYGATRDLGASLISPYARFTVKAQLSVSGTLYVQESNDNFATFAFTASTPLTANTSSTITMATTSRYIRSAVGNGSTAGQFQLHNTALSTS